MFQIRRRTPFDERITKPVTVATSHVNAAFMTRNIIKSSDIHDLALSVSSQSRENDKFLTRERDACAVIALITAWASVPLHFRVAFFPRDICLLRDRPVSSIDLHWVEHALIRRQRVVRVDNEPLTSDGCVCSARVVRRPQSCFENNIILCRLLSQTLHRFQPCDAKVFNALK